MGRMATFGRQKHLRKKGRRMVRFGIDRLEKTGFTMNVSLSGVHIKTNSVFKPGSTVQVELDLPAGKHTLWGKVVWAKKVPSQLAHVLPCGMGVRFINPGKDFVEAYESWVKG